MLQLALDVGFWNRLMAGIGNAAIASVNWVVELAASFPTSTILSHTEAGSILNLGRAARQASVDWLAGVPSSQLVIPKVPLPGLPNIDGGPDGRFNFGVIFKDGGISGGAGGGGGKNTNVLFSANEITPLDDFLSRMRSFAEAHSRSSEGLRNWMIDLADQWERGMRPKDEFGDFIILPNYITESPDF